MLDLLGQTLQGLVVGDGTGIDGLLIALHAGTGRLEVALDALLFHLGVRQRGRLGDDLLGKGPALDREVLELGQLGQGLTTVLGTGDQTVSPCKIEKLPLILCRGFHADLLRFWPR